MVIHTFEAADATSEGLLSGFLHDMACSWDTDAFDEPQATVSIRVKRLYYEEPHHLFRLLRGTKYRTVPSVLTIRNVIEASIEPQVVPFRRWGPTTFGYADKKGTVLSLFFEGADITLRLSEWAPISLLDCGTASPDFEHSYWGYPPERHAWIDATMRERRSVA